MLSWISLKGGLWPGGGHSPLPNSKQQDRRKAVQGKFRLDIGEKFFTERVRELSRAVMESSSLEGFKSYVDMAFENMV